jgi:hypothetical protein
MKLTSRKFWSTFVAAGVAVGINFATEWKYDLIVWGAVFVLVVLAAWLESRIDSNAQRMVLSERKDREPTVLRWEERNGSSRRSVYTTSEKVATEFVKRVPALVRPDDLTSNRSSKP